MEIRPYWVWLLVCEMALIAMILTWPKPIPEAIFTLQSALDYVDDRFSGGPGQEKIDAMRVWYARLNDYQRACRVVAITAAVLGQAIGRVASIMAGCGQLTRRYLLGWLGAITLSFIVMSYLPFPRDAVWGNTFHGVEVIAMLIYSILIATCLEALAFTNLYIARQISRNRNCGDRK